MTPYNSITYDDQVSNSGVSYVDRSGLAPIGDVGFEYPNINLLQVFIGSLQVVDAASIVGTGIVATGGTFALTKNPALTTVVGAEMLPLLYPAYIEGKEGFHNIYEGLDLKDKKKPGGSGGSCP